MLKEYNFKTQKGNIIPVCAYSLQEAREILQAYIDKHSLDWIVEWQRLNSK